MDGLIFSNYLEFVYPGLAIFHFVDQAFEEDYMYVEERCMATSEAKISLLGHPNFGICSCLSLMLADYLILNKLDSKLFYLIIHRVILSCVRINMTYCSDCNALIVDLYNLL